MEPKLTFGVISAIKVIIEDENGLQQILFEEKKKDFLPNYFNIEYRMLSGVAREFEFGSFKSKLSRSGEIGFSLHFLGQRKPEGDKAEVEPLKESEEYKKKKKEDRIFELEQKAKDKYLDCIEWAYVFDMLTEDEKTEVRKLHKEVYGTEYPIKK